MKYLLLIIIPLTLTGCFSREPEKTGYEGTPMPSFKLLLQDSLTYLDTKNISLGKPVVMLYYGPYCPFSRAQMEDIIENISILKEVDFYIFTSWPFDDMKKFNIAYKLYKYPNITGGMDYTHFFPNYFEAKGVPYIAIYGKDKKFKKAFFGKTSSYQIKKAAQS
jgi:hypothetical protein